MFIVLLSYRKEINEVEKFIEPHIQLLNRYYAEKKIVFSGRKNPRTGGIIVFRDMNETEVMEFIKQDPFYQNEIADYDTTEVIPTKYDENFACFFGIEFVNNGLKWDVPLNRRTVIRQLHQARNRCVQKPSNNFLTFIITTKSLPIFPPHIC